MVDMLRAVRTFCDSNDRKLNSQLFLAGFSQGGHATVAAHRELERFHTDEFTVTASAPMAGPYDLESSCRYLLTDTSYPEPFYFIYILAAWLPIYHLGDTLQGLLAGPYATRLPPVLDGRHSDEVYAASGPSVQAMLDRDFRSQLFRDPEHPFWLAARENNVLDWAPRAPVRLYHSAGDLIVKNLNATTAQEAWIANGACCVEVVDPGAPARLSHGDSRKPSLRAAKTWFDSFGQ